MKKSDVKYQSYIQILKEELIPAMGCTEPIALAYAAAKAREILGVLPDRVAIGASGSIIKNVKSVIVPNTDHLRGIPAAATAGIVAGKAEKELEVISEVSKEQIEQMKTFLDTVDISVEHVDYGVTFDILVDVWKETDHAKVRIANFHTNIVHIEKNGEILLDIPVEDDSDKGLTDRSLLDVESIWDFITTVDIKDIHDLLKRQIECNTAIAEEGLRGNYGANIGKVLLKTYGNDVRTRAKAMAAAGSDARMNGCELPVIINAGSGNQGMTCSLPLLEYAKEYQIEEETLYRALALSNLIAIHQKTGIGRLSAYCGAISAGCAAACGVAYLLGEDLETISKTLTNSLAITSGIICDGAKASCAAKIATAVESGLMGYYICKNKKNFCDGDGIIGIGVEKTIKNIGTLASKGMRETDKVIIGIMTE